MKIVQKTAIYILILMFSVSVMIIPSKAETITQGYINASNLRVRADASTSADILDMVSYITTTVISSKYDKDGNIWYLVTYQKDMSTITGYVYGTYVVLSTYETGDSDKDFEEQLKSFPESYHSYLRTLHNSYPKWIFTPDNINMSLDEAVALENKSRRKETSQNDPISYRSMGENAYDWSNNQWIVDNGGWVAASRELIAYYMDPRNFLDSNYVYTFLEQSYNPAIQTESGVKSIIKGTFLEKGYSDSSDTAYGGSYVNVIMEAAKKSNVSPYIIASTIIQEQGVNGTSSLISGTTQYGKYYNFFNVKASGSSSSEVIKNGLTYANQQGWSTRSASIIGGAIFVGKSYISIGQDTYYYMNFNIKNPDKLWHQYAQAVHNAASSGARIKNEYSKYNNSPLTFKIPVYQNTTETISSKPSQNSYKNNYYFSSISVYGLTPSFSMYNYNYNLSVSGNTTLNVSVPTNATIINNDKIAISKGENKVILTVKSESGYKTDYTVNVNSSCDCTLFVPGGKSVNFPDAPTVNKFSDTFIILNEEQGYEYSIDKTNWQQSGSFLNLNSNTDYYFYKRKSASQTEPAGLISNVLKIKTKKSSSIIPLSPTVNLIGSTKIHIFTQDGIEYSLDKINWQSDGLFEGLSKNQTYTIYSRYKETDTTGASNTSFLKNVKTDGNDKFLTFDASSLVISKKYIIFGTNNMEADVNEDFVVDIKDLIHLKKLMS